MDVVCLGPAGFAALVGIFGKLGMSGIDSTFGTAMRALVMQHSLSQQRSYSASGSLLARSITRHSFGSRFLVWPGLFLGSAIFYALKYGQASSVAAIDKTSVALVLIFAVLFLDKVFTWKNGLGATLMVAGAILMILK